MLYKSNKYTKTRTEKNICLFVQSSYKFKNCPLNNNLYLSMRIVKASYWKWSTWMNNNTDRTHLFKIQDFFVHNKPETEAQRSYAHALSALWFNAACVQLLWASTLWFLWTKKPLNREKDDMYCSICIVFNLWWSIW